MKILVWTLRGLISFLFLLSAVAKMFPLWSFEKQLVDLGIASWCQSHYWARLLIGLELAIGFAILFPHYLKSLIIPGTILLLVLFCAHLGIEIYKHGTSGNCGCFGQLIPMTPVEAIIKNIVTIGILIFLYRKVSDKEKGQNKIIYPLSIFLASCLAMFMFFPFAPCKADSSLTNDVTTANIVDSAFQETVSINTLNDTVKSILEKKDTLNKKVKKDSVAVPSAKAVKEAENVKPAVESAPKNVSKFSQFTTIGNVPTNIHTGKKVICMFSAGCDHCRATAKELGQLAKTVNMPDVFILFMNEETELIPEFFKEAGVKYPYSVLEIPKFWEVMGPDATTPGVFYLKDGKLIKSYVGIAESKFEAEDFKKQIQ